MFVFDGNKFSEKILENIKKKKLKLKLAVILIGEDKASKIFVKIKEKACQKTGIDFQLFHFPENTNKVALKEQIIRICQDSSNSGVVIQLPLPKWLETKEVLNLIPKEKDIDLLSEESMAEFFLGRSKRLPPVVSAVDKIFKNQKINIKGKNIVLAGSGRLVGFPLSVWFINQGATISVLNSKTKNISHFTKLADILISGAGKARIIKGEMIKKGAFLIDAGSSVENGKTEGDIDFKSIAKKAGFISKVPGGLGPVTVACLLENLTK